MNTRRLIILTALALSAGLFCSGCTETTPVDPDAELLMQKSQDLFMRIKANDYEVIYENEFPYLREMIDIEEYLKNRYITYYKPDTLVAIEIDSATVGADTAYVHMKTEWVHADSSFSVDTIKLLWLRVDEDWYKPTLSNMAKQEEYEEELRVYWEAVREIEQREAQQGDSL